MGAWLVGVLLGNSLFKTKRRMIRISGATLVTGWTLSMLTLCAILFATYPLHQLNYAGPIVLDAFCESIIRVLWSLSLAWIIFACVQGYGGVINKILCLSIWQPLGKLSYSTYLLHYPIQMIFTSSQRQPQYFSDLFVLRKFCGDAFISVLVAFFWVLLFEMPIVGLGKIMFKKPRGRDLESAEDDAESEKLCP